MELKIEKLIYGGDGLARLPADSQGRLKTAFIPLVLPGELIEASVIEEKPGFIRAQLDRVLQPSADRISPACPYFGECGGCHYQQIAYEKQLAAKQEILRETIVRIAKLELPAIEVHSSEPWNYRNRTRMRIRHADRRFPFALGYYRVASHELLPVRECPISSPLINRAITALWQAGELQKFPKEVAEVEFFANHDDSRLLLELWVEPGTGPKKEFPTLWDDLKARVPELAGMSLLPQPSRSAPDPIPQPDAENAGVPIANFGAAYLEYKTRGRSHRVSAGAFFQTNRHMTDTLIDLVTAGAEGELAWDLYSGVGLFSLPLTKSFDQVTAVEASPISVADLRHNVPPQVKTLELPVDRFLSRSPKKVPDLINVDPPRAGLGRGVAEQLGAIGASRFNYVSCDPSTLARDLVPLLGRPGHKVEQAHLLDLFPQTFHLESILKLVR